MAIIEDIERQFHRLYASYTSPLQLACKDFGYISNYQTKLIRDLEKFRRDNEQVATWFEDDIRGYISQRGWFVSGSLYTSQFPALKKAIEDKKEDDIEYFLMRHVRSTADDTAAEAYAKWPHRKAILTDAFEAHFRKKYILSIPVMLAQADGMALEILGAHLFTDSTGEIGDKAKKVINGEINHRPLAKSFLGLLLESSGLRISTKNRDKKKAEGSPVSPLNRHGVLHGIDWNYPKECNSLRALALINFLNWAYEIVHKESTA